MKKRMVLKMKFGGAGQGADTHGVRLYGSFPGHEGAKANIAIVCEDNPGTGSASADYKHITFWFLLKSLVPYGKILDFSKKLNERLQEEGYITVRSSIDNLVDTTQPIYYNKPESKFPLKPNNGGYNAANGFSIVVEKPGSDQIFSREDIDEVKQMTIEFGYIVYGRRLPEG